MLEISYYLSKKSFEQLIKSLADIIPKGCSMVFNYPDQHSYTKNAKERTKKQVMLTADTDESMLTSYSYKNIEKYNLLIYEHLTPEDIALQFFSKYNTANSLSKISALDNVNYCLAVKQ